MITEEQLKRWAPECKYPAVVVSWFNKYATQYMVTSPVRIAAFFAQLMHESASFNFLKEIASGKAYEGRKDLGNILPGDGIKYKGRGYIQITGRTNYIALSNAIFKDDTLVKNPDLVATPQYGMLSAFWFWTEKGLNHYADIQYFETITKRINGGLNGFDNRIHFYNIILKDFGLAIYSR